jgi:3-mercaptopyruvate sulfurtransferase SseA
VRRLVVTLVTGGVLLLGAAPAAPPDAPVTFIKADELKALLDRGTRADIIDVRAWDAYQEMHIKGARSMPIRAIEARAGEISKTGLVVFY